MLERLLESKATKERSAMGTIASITTHTALIGAALYGTAHARMHPIESPETVRAVFFPPAQNPVATIRPTTGKPQHSPSSRRLIFVDPHIDVSVPRIEINDVLSRPGDFNPRPTSLGRSDAVGESLSRPAGTPFLADQVDRQVVVVPGSPAPRYPELLRSSGVEGQVIAEFIVDEHGRVEEGSLRFVRSDNALFEDAVRAAIRRTRFVPAEVGGRKVKQLVQMPFVFTLAR